MAQPYILSGQTHNCVVLLHQGQVLVLILSGPLCEVRARREETTRRQLHVPLPALCVPYKGLTGSTHGCSLGCLSCSSLWGADPAEPCRDSCWWRLPGLFLGPTIVALPHGAPGHSDWLK